MYIENLQDDSIKTRIEEISELLERFPNMKTKICGNYEDFYISLYFADHTLKERESDHFSLIRIAKFLADNFITKGDHEFSEGETHFRITVEWDFFEYTRYPLIYLRFDKQDIDGIITVLKKLTEPEKGEFNFFIKSDIFRC